MSTTVFVKTKSLFTSKMFWLGAAQVLVGVGELLTDVLGSSDPAAAGTIVTGIATIILRATTKQPVRTPFVDDVPAKEMAGTKTEPRT